MNLNEIWNLHLQGSTRKAAVAAKEKLDAIAQELDAQTPHDRVDTARQVVTLSRKAALDKPGVSSGEMILAATDAVLEHYPVGITSEVAQNNSHIWEGVYGDQSAQVAGLRDFFTLLSTVSIASGNTRVAELAHNIQKLIQTYHLENPTERNGIIFTLEKSDYLHAKSAYEQFLMLENTPFDQFVTVTTRLIGRARNQSDWALVGKLLKILYVKTNQEQQERAGQWKDTVFAFKQLLYYSSAFRRDVETQSRAFLIGSTDPQQINIAAGKLATINFASTGLGKATRV